MPSLTRTKKIAAGLLLLPLLLAACLAFLPWLGFLKPRIEAEASRSSGLQVAIKGGLGMTLLRGLEISAGDISVRDEGVEVLKAGKVRVRVGFLPLLKGQFRILRIDLIAPAFHLVGKKAKKPAAGPAGEGIFTLESLNISSGSLVYTGKKGGKELEVEAIGLAAKELVYGGPAAEAFYKKLSFTGGLSCGRLDIGRLALTGVSMDLKAGKGVFTAARFGAGIFGGAGKGSFKADLASVPPAYSLDYALGRFRIEELLRFFSSGGTDRKMLEGPAELSLGLSARGESAGELERSLSGGFSLRGEELVLYNIDIDAVITRFERSQNFNLLDAGAFLLAGPLGMAVTKSYNFTDLALSRGEKGGVRKFSSSWKLEDGALEAVDVALASKNQRLAAKGRINTADGRFEDLTVAVLDKRGCAAYSQKIKGSLANPQLGKVSMLESLTGPVTSVLGKVVKLLPGLECRVFYSGSVPHPAEE